MLLRKNYLMCRENGKELEPNLKDILFRGGINGDGTERDHTGTEVGGRM